MHVCVYIYNQILKKKSWTQKFARLLPFLTVSTLLVAKFIKSDNDTQKYKWLFLYINKNNYAYTLCFAQLDQV